MESQPQNPEFRNNAENFHSCNLHVHISDTFGSENLKQSNWASMGSLCKKT